MPLYKHIADLAGNTKLVRMFGVLEPPLRLTLSLTTQKTGSKGASVYDLVVDFSMNHCVGPKTKRIRSLRALQPNSASLCRQLPSQEACSDRATMYAACIIW